MDFVFFMQLKKFVIYRAVSLKSLVEKKNIKLVFWINQFIILFKKKFTGIVVNFMII